MKDMQENKDINQNKVEADDNKEKNLLIGL